MTDNLLLSVVLGLALAAMNGGLSLFVLKRAMGLPNAQFMQRVLASLGIRMLVLLVVMGLVLWLLPVHALGFAVAFVAGLLVSLGVEMWIVLRWLRPAP